MLLSTAGDTWTQTKSTKFWEGAAVFLKNSAGTKRTSKLPGESHLCLCDTKINLRTGGACRTRVNKVLSVRFQSPLIAEKFF